MPLIDLHAAPNKSMRRWFGLSLGIVLAILAIMAAPAGMFRQAIFVGAVSVVGVYYLSPRTQLPIIRGWQWITFPIAWLVGHFLFGMVFFGIITPLGFLLRLFGHDPLNLRRENHVKSAWEDKACVKDVGNEDPTRYFKQF
ncbi:hypothetical protein FHS27_005346 [Rhodopirellula rubra]|uniref:Uncharacterized protein n=1 Tax=Aporhodopirellula rubra TaxID=980271 RepID=A0A7W5E3F8_9BACT|nr:SxtJ family membrane protein [Aporhodopirellula rubra]MBB3209506.1 hypothetical protein [Aporhodopirellula rubra]